MFLSGEQFQQLEDAFNDAFESFEALNDLVRTAHRQSLDMLSLTSSNTGQTINLMIDKASKGRWLAALINTALVKRPDDEALQVVRDQLLPEIGWHEQLNPFDIGCPRDGRVLLDREGLRKALCNIHRADGKRIVIVDGTPRSGKTHSWELIRYLATTYNFFRIVDIDLDRLMPAEIQAEDLGRSIVTQMGLVPVPELFDQQKEHWGHYFGDWLYGQISGISTVYWIVIDSFYGKLLPPRTRDFVRELAYRIDKQLDKLRLILLSYQDRDVLNSDIPGRIEYEFIKTIEARDLLPFFLSLYEERKALRKIPFTRNDVVNSTGSVWRQVDHNDPHRMTSLEQAAFKEARRILAPPPPPATRQQMLAEMEEQLDALNLDFVPSFAPVPTDPRYGPYYQAAAVLSFFRATSLRPVPGVPGEESINDVLNNSKQLLDDRQEERFALLPEIRQDVLQQIGSRESLWHALEANTPLPEDPLQQMLALYISGDAPPLSRQELSQVTATFQVVDWLENIIPDLPDRSAIRQRQELLGLLQPFRELAGDNFRGRRQELHMLRTYVGVLPTDSPSSNGRLAATASDLQDKPPAIYGPGGVGKSTLLARLILDHAVLSDEQRFPWAYVDFDRPGVRIEEPLTILVESVQQLGILYPDARKFCDKVRDTMREQIVKYKQRRRSRGSATGDSNADKTLRDWERYSKDFANLLKNLRLKQSAPFLLVLDTFERAQRHSPVVVASLCSFLGILERSVPHLKTVFVGRAPIRGTADYPTRLYPLEGFDAETAQSYLEAEAGELLTPGLAKDIVISIGPHPLPLTLKLVVLALQKVGRDGIEELLQRGLLMFHLEESELQGHLFLRILGHIDDPDVRKLAYPGFVLRRVTPILICEVLATPCGIELKQPDEAQRLFEALRRDESLVLVEDGALRHRPELRTVMIRQIRRQDRDKARRIEEAAVAYYERQEGLVARAEELYHRLSLHQPITTLDERWVDDDVVKSLLEEALDELSGPEKAWLAARLDFPLTPEDRAQADLESWERDTEQRVRELLQRDGAERVLAILQEREERSPDSPLYELQAQAWELLGDWKAAAAVIKKGLSSASHYQFAAALLIHCARLETRLEDFQAARQHLDEAEKLLINRDENTLFLLEIGLQYLGLDRVGRKGADTAFKERLCNLFTVLSDEQVASQPVLMGWFAGELGRDHPAAITRIICLTGLYTDRKVALRTLGRALAALEYELVSREGWPVGELARMAGLPETVDTVEAWTAHLQKGDADALAQFITTLLVQFPSPPPLVLDAIIEILCERAWGGPNPIAIVLPGSNRLSTSARQATSAHSFYSSPSEEPTSEYKPVGLGKLTSSQLSQFSKALLDAFDRNALAQMMQFRLERHLDAISLSEDLKTTVLTLIQQAQEEEWTAQLLAAALDARPENPLLLAFANRFGLAPRISSSRKSRRIESSEQLFKISSGNFTDTTEMLSHLGRLETQVCCVEIDTASYGTGFLVGPDVLMTSYHVIEPVVKRNFSPQQVLLRFNYKILSDNKTVGTGTVYHLANDWLIDYSLNEQLDFALLRLSSEPGNEPVGGERAEPDAPSRGWIALPSFAPAIFIDTPLIILQHMEGGPLQLTYHKRGITGLNDSGTCLFHRVNTGPGSAGAPCFNQNWELIAIHQGKSTTNDGTHINTAIPTTAIFAMVSERNTFVSGQPPDLSVNLNQLLQNIHLRVSTAIQSIQYAGVPFSGRGYVSPRRYQESVEALRTVRSSLLDLRQYLDDTLLNPATSLPDSIVQRYPASISHINGIVAEVETFSSTFVTGKIDRQLIQRKAEALISDLHNLEEFIQGTDNSS